MDRRAKRWIQALGAVLGVQLLLGAENLYASGAFSQPAFSPDGSSQVVLWNLVADQAVRTAVETVVLLGLLALARLVSRWLLHGRFATAVTALLLLLGSYIDVFVEFKGMALGGPALVWGLTNDLQSAAVPVIAGAWVLWGRRPEPRTGLVAAAVPGVWDGGGSVLQFEPDGVFTVTSGGLVSVAGLWEPGPDGRSQVVLKVDSPTDLGHGWQATLLDLELTGHAARLHSGAAVSYLRREPELVLQETGGYIGAVEVLEA
ncbi:MULTISPECIES: hypothetical protein [Streptacidiphilus]|uniref:Uncharacterized protein n=1 Tax=Streptacidiphilus cavernicola TaxID=3342716 RepID=A0ABV6UWS7_9ACTN|nr:hypothetical protein [Streptacidiphilus jeojiense]